MSADTVYVGMGSNLGDRVANLYAALQALGRIDAVAVLACSSLYDSAPVGPPQPRYLNAVVELECALPPSSLLAILQQIEKDLGRVRETHWGPRPMDLDILLWESKVIAQPDLQVPHLQMHKRRFVLEPLAEIAPQRRHPLSQETVEQLLRKLPPADVTRHSEPGWSVFPGPFEDL